MGLKDGRASTRNAAAVDALSQGAMPALWAACQTEGYVHDTISRADGSPLVRLGVRVERRVLEVMVGLLQVEE